ncbi:MAG: response regulator, partial [Desulfobulbaceae bacterium]|nr:response regulator [Desulfobulbaceae bacterium]
MNGIEAAEEINTLNIPVVYLTAHADTDTLDRAKTTAPYGYIIKPFDERMLQSTIEITLYKSRMENKLKEREAWLFTILKSIGDAVIATDINSHVTFMNPVAEATTGWKEKEAQGKPLIEVFNIINEKTRKPCENPVEKVLASGKTVGLANHTALISRDQTERLIADSGAPIRRDTGEIIGVVLVFRDITVNQKMEEELRQMRNIESIGLLAGGIAHDFNNILTGILGNINIAQIVQDDPEKVATCLNDAETACYRAKELTGQLITFSKGGAPVKKNASLKKLIEESSGFILSGSNVQRELALPDDLWSVDIDPGQINQVINNIIINADQAMPGGGRLWVTAENITVNEDDTLPLAAGKYVKVTFRDQGIGIPGTYIEKIFDPYFTTKQAGKGLGLASAFSILKQHNGIITVDSAPGVGTSFSMYLPASLKQQEIEQDTPQQKISGSGSGKILVMDDDDMVRNVTSEMLTTLGYEVETARNGVEAIKLYQQSSEAGKPYDAVILDLTIPGGMGGRETIEKLLAINPEIKAIVSSGYSNDPILSEYQKYGFCEVLVKP